MANFVLGLIHNPDVLREHVREQAAREKAALRGTRKQITALAQRVYEAVSERDRYNRLYAHGKLTDAGYDGYTKELNTKRNATEEMAELREKRERERAERYGAVYAMLGLKVVAHHDGSLEITWRGGDCKLSGLRR